MLKQRIITALLLLAVFLPTLLYPSIEPFAAFTLLLIGAAAWEWARLNGCGSVMAQGAGVAMALAGLVFWLLGGMAGDWQGLWLGLGVAWVLLALLMLRGGSEGLRRCPAALRLWLGLFLIGCAWLALVQARLVGLGFLLSVLMLVWAADIAAYFGGRRFGRRKLAPSISPGKSWEGAISGLLGVLLLAALAVWATRQGWVAPGHLFDRLWALGPVLAVAALLFLTGMSVVGDLVESLVKRTAGVKDSSGLLPGHGGVLDRIDALLPVLPLSLMFVHV